MKEYVVRCSPCPGALRYVRVQAPVLTGVSGRRAYPRTCARSSRARRGSAGRIDLPRRATASQARGEAWSLLRTEIAKQMMRRLLAAAGHHAQASRVPK